MRSSNIPNRYNYADYYNPIAYITNPLPFIIIIIIIIITIIIFRELFLPYILTYLAKTK